ncbi:MAG: hypothetical protein PHR60_03650 [Eubacteriales bacterium]|nr:hypothetical protein [Eubacteriales bacterium]MDD4583266.1 hypothetical protein [Eubacteriales bacterium]
MEFFNNLGKKLSEVAGDTADKAKELAEIAKLKSEIASLQRRLQTSYAEMGKDYYVQEKNKEDSPVAGLCSQISQSLAAIAELEGKIEDIKNE